MSRSDLQYCPLLACHIFKPMTFGICLRSSSRQTGLDPNSRVTRGHLDHSSGNRAWIAAATLTAGAAFRAVDRHGRVGPGPLGCRVHRPHREACRGNSRTGFRPLCRPQSAVGLRHPGVPQRCVRSVHYASDPPHKSLNTLRKYIRDRSLFRDNPAAKLGL
jgi:hypothetical protein